MTEHEPPPPELAFYARHRQPSEESARSLAARLEHPPSAPGPTRRPVVVGLGGLTVASALGALLLTTLPREPEGPIYRGVESMPAHREVLGSPTAPPILDLRIAVERGGTAWPAGQGERHRVGEKVFFRLYSSREAEVLLWVEGPAGAERIGGVGLEAGQAVDLGSGGGMLAYEFEVPGRYTFIASTDGMGRCVMPSCARKSLEVR